MHDGTTDAIITLYTDTYQEVLLTIEPSNNLITEEKANQPGRKEQTLEVLVFLFLILPSIVLTPFALRQVEIGFVLVAISAILRDLALVSLIIFFLWRNREPVNQIGLTSRAVWQNIVLGIVLYIPILITAGIITAILQEIGLSAPPPDSTSFLVPRGTGELVLAFVLVIVVAFSEEIIFRGYLIRRFTNATRSVPAAVLLSTLIFSVGHGYQGTAGIVTVGLLGLAFALIYIWRKSLVAPITLHFIQDFIGLILLPLLGLR